MQRWIMSPLSFFLHAALHPPHTSPAFSWAPLPCPLCWSALHIKSSVSQNTVLQKTCSMTHIRRVLICCMGKYHHGVAESLMYSRRAAAYLFWLLWSVVIEDDEVSVCHIEAWQVVHGCLCIIDILIHHICCSARLFGCSSAEQASKSAISYQQ